MAVGDVSRHLDVGDDRGGDVVFDFFAAFAIVLLAACVAYVFYMAGEEVEHHE